MVVGLPLAHAGEALLVHLHTRRQARPHKTRSFNQPFGRVLLALIALGPSLAAYAGTLALRGFGGVSQGEGSDGRWSTSCTPRTASCGSAGWCSGEPFRQQKKELGELGLMCVPLSTPGFPAWLDSFEGNLEGLTYACFDHPELFEELRELHHRQAVSVAEVIADSGMVDSVLLGMSGAIILQSPQLFDRLSLPTIREVTRILKTAGVVCGLHACGKERHVVQRCARETDLDYINPLEVPPMGDCDLGRLKEEFGGRLALMGNLHTTEVMLRGTSATVRAASLRALLQAWRRLRLVHRGPVRVRHTPGKHPGDGAHGGGVRPLPARRGAHPGAVGKALRLSGSLALPHVWDHPCSYKAGLASLIPSVRPTGRARAEARNEERRTGSPWRSCRHGTWPASRRTIRIRPGNGPSCRW